MDERVYRDTMQALQSCLPAREGTVPEWALRIRTYLAALQRAKVEQCDFLAACDRIFETDEWFPTVARIIAVADECARERKRRSQPVSDQVTRQRRLVCPYCHGARWLRRHTGPEPIVPCPHCTSDGVYDLSREQWTIRDEGGVPDPNDRTYMPDMSQTTWRLPRTADGRPDMDALYRESRRLRGLDPAVDERVRPAAGFASLGSLFQGTDEPPAPPEPDTWDELTF